MSINIFQPKVSVIIPVYNPGYFIDATLESITKQSYKNIEIILIDDGSSDESKKIIDKYLSQDKRISYYHQNNEGVCSARNNGIRKATGDYLFFSDDDDLVYPDTISKLVSLIQEKNYDFIKYSIDYLMKEINREYLIEDYKFKDISFEAKDIRDNYLYLLKTGALVFIWNGLYRREFLLNNSIFFDDSSKFRIDDQSFNMVLFEKSHSFYLSSYTGYKHFCRVNQSEATLLNLEKLEDSTTSYLNLEYDTCRRMNIKPDDYLSVLGKEIGTLFWNVTIKDDRYSNEDRIRCVKNIREGLNFIDNLSKMLDSSKISIIRFILISLFIRRCYHVLYDLFFIFRLFTGTRSSIRPRIRKH